MTGSTLDLILIAVVVVILLAAGMVLVFYADAHPAWRRPETRAGHGTSGQAARPPAGLPEHSPAAAHRETRTSPPGRDTGALDATLPEGKPTAAGRAPARAVPS
jgi:flagellar basal body-associated protein FliL